MGGYFTVVMLKQDYHISKGIKGIDPDGTDRERTNGEAAWFKAHPVMTAELRGKKRVTGLNGVSEKRGVRYPPPWTKLDPQFPLIHDIIFRKATNSGRGI
jgi:hypothetical protein